LQKNLPKDFKAKGDIYVFVDECHRTQSGDLHKAMKAILPSAMFIGFTGTPLLKSDKQKSIEVFGTYIHTYKYDQAVRDGVVLDLRYEARDIDQNITSQDKIDQWFEAKTRVLNDIAVSSNNRTCRLCSAPSYGENRGRHPVRYGTRSPKQTWQCHARVR
jgi:type I restriction enzyme R subunit